MTPQEYCREIEAYLCRKNDGHLIRIVGPSFELVCGWAGQGIPFRIACQGIDAYFERYYAKAGRRRPVHIDFCEHDVLGAFDAWRRAVGVDLNASSGASDETSSRRSARSLPEHLDRVCERATARRATLTPPPPELDAMLERVVTEAAGFRDLPGPIRGEVRERIKERLAALDRSVVEVARAQLDPSDLDSLRAEARGQLAPFRDRMAPDTYERAIEAAIDRLVRERQQLPSVAFE